MKLKLPQQTIQMVQNAAIRKAAAKEVHPFLGSRDFQIGIPGELGEFVSQRVRPPKQKLPKVYVPAQIMVPMGIPGQWDEACRLTHELQASPVGYFQGRNYTGSNLAGYIGMSNALRAASERGKSHWGAAGWELTESDAPKYADEIHRVEDLLKRAKTVEAGLEVLRSMEMRERELAWRAVQAAIGKGDLDLWRQQVAPRYMDWEGVQAMVLPMRIITEEQVSMVIPWMTLDRVRDNMREWIKDGYLDTFGERGGLQIYRVTERAVERGLEDGVLDTLEAAGRLIVRRGQELHDLAVGDALILTALQVAEQGGEILEVKTEQALKLAFERGVFPDYEVVLQASASGPIESLAVEVVGLGGTYRGAPKKAAVAGAGIAMLHTGLDGKGVRYA